MAFYVISIIFTVCALIITIINKSYSESAPYIIIGEFIAISIIFSVKFITHNMKINKKMRDSFKEENNSTIPDTDEFDTF